jgi:TRAP-type mannitol/chloroaromatic compound transport system permease small subunit
LLQTILLIDSISSWVAKAFAWCIMIMTFGISYEVFMRYILSDPTPWAFDLSYMMYGALFMMAGAYALSRDSHVRGDVIYRLLAPRTQARIEFVLYFIFFFPGILALIFAGWKYAALSLSYKEVSVYSPANIPIYQFKMLIPAAGFLLLMQGIAQVFRCILCMKTGIWPPHLEDVEETETMLMHGKEDEEQVRKQFGIGGGA